MEVLEFACLGSTPAEFNQLQTFGCEGGLEIKFPDVRQNLLFPLFVPLRNTARRLLFTRESFSLIR